MGPERYDHGVGDPVPYHRRNPRRTYDAAGRERTPMTIANARANRGEAIRAGCRCGHVADVPLARFPDAMFVPDAGLRLRCLRCGRRGVGAHLIWGQPPTGLRS